MAYTIKAVFDIYEKAMEEFSDPRVENWFLMKSVFPILGILAAYLYFVLKWGPQFMETRNAFNIDKILILYNLLQVLACLYIVHAFCLLVPKYNYWCEPVDYTSEDLYVAKHVWFYHILKVTDLLDTIFFVLRKKQNQITFLHVYHHAGMAITTWIATRFIPGGTVIYLGGYNCIVHVVMYTYYLLSVWNKKLKENIWLKKRLTQLQLIQFGLTIFQHAAVLLQPSCKSSKFVSLFLVIQNLFMVMLFGEFYYKTYVRKKQYITSNSQQTNQFNNKET